MALTTVVAPALVVEDGVTPLSAGLLNLLGSPIVSVSGTIGGNTAVGVDGVTIDQNGAGDTLQVIDGGISEQELAVDAVTAAIIDNGAVSYRTLGVDAFIGTNLLEQNLVVTPNAPFYGSRVDINADLLFMPAVTGSNGYWLRNVDLTVDIEASGANGLDTGTENWTPGVGEWFYIWVIYDPDEETVAGLLSRSSTAPTLPTGYTCKRRVGVVRNLSQTGNFKMFLQRGRKVWTEEGYPLSNATPTGTANTLSLADYVPPIARMASGSMGLDTVGSTMGGNMAVAANAAGLGQVVHGCSKGTRDAYDYVTVFKLASPFRVPLVTAQQLTWWSEGFGTYASIMLTGYEY